VCHVHTDAGQLPCDDATEYACANGDTCIAWELVNNTVNDCKDNSDEGKFTVLFFVRMHTTALRAFGHNKTNWNRFLLVVKGTALKQQLSKFYPQTLNTDRYSVIDIS